jgi:hypothetical protein
MTGLLPSFKNSSLYIWGLIEALTMVRPEILLSGSRSPVGQGASQTTLTRDRIFYLSDPSPKACPYSWRTVQRRKRLGYARGLPVRGLSYRTICRYGSYPGGIRSVSFFAKALACLSGSLKGCLLFLRCGTTGLLSVFFRHRRSFACHMPPIRRFVVRCSIGRDPI